MDEPNFIMLSGGSNRDLQRMSVSEVARPRNHFRYNSLTVPV